MGAEFFVARCYEIGGVGLVIAGSVESGEFGEGCVGRTFKGKKFTLVKIEKEGAKIPRACEKDKVNLFIKHITRADLRPGELLYFD